MGTNLLILVVTLVLTLSGCAGELCEERKFSLLDSEDSQYKSCPGPDDPAHFTACCPGPVWSERSESCPLSPVSCPLSLVSCLLSLVSCLPSLFYCLSVFHAHLTGNAAPVPASEYWRTSLMTTTVLKERISSLMTRMKPRLGSKCISYWHCHCFLCWQQGGTQRAIQERCKFY